MNGGSDQVFEYDGYGQRETGEPSPCLLVCNKLYIKTMRTMGAVIYDSGLNGYASAGQFYGMELEVLEGYENLVPMY